MFLGAFAVVLVVATFGCADGPEELPPTPRSLGQPAAADLAPTAEPTTITTPIVRPPPASTPLPRRRDTVRVLRVWDGQTFLVEGGYVVRLLGVAAPGAGVLGKPMEPGGSAAARRLSELVNGREVQLEEDVVDVDGDGFLWRYVYVGGLFVNAEMVRQGLARVEAGGHVLRHLALLQELEATARAERRGIWAAGVPQPTPPAG